MSPSVGALFVYPLKSAAGIAVDELTFDARGPVGDRRWMLVDAHGTALTQRELPRLALIQPSFLTPDHNGAIRLDVVATNGIAVAPPTHGFARDVRIWDDVVPVYDAGDRVADWCSNILNVACRLVYLADVAHRPLNARFAGPLPATGRETTLSDGAPVLLLGQASIDALNARLIDAASQPVTLLRFRPNILVHGITAHDEDQWSEIVIGAVTMGVGAPCARCVITTIDPHTATAGIEPLRTLATYRRQSGAVMFGVNASVALHTDAAVRCVSVDDSIQVRVRKTSV